MWISNVPDRGKPQRIVELHSEYAGGAYKVSALDKKSKSCCEGRCPIESGDRHDVDSVHRSVRHTHHSNRDLLNLFLKAFDALKCSKNRGRWRQ